MFFSIVIGFAQGFSIPVAQAFGAKDYDELRRNVVNATSLGLLTAAAITAIALLVVTPVLNTMGTPDEVRPMAAAYLRVLFSGIPIVMGYNLLSGILRALLLPGLIGYTGLFWAEVLAWLGADVILIPSYYRMYRHASKQAV